MRGALLLVAALAVLLALGGGAAFRQLGFVKANGGEV